MTYELFSVGDKYIQDLIEALFFLLLTGHKPHNHRHNLKKKKPALLKDVIFYIFSILSIYFFLFVVVVWL